MLTFSNLYAILVTADYEATPKQVLRNKLLDVYKTRGAPVARLFVGTTTYRHETDPVVKKLWEKFYDAPSTNVANIVSKLPQLCKK
jgi:hypothetical protein